MVDDIPEEDKWLRSEYTPNPIPRNAFPCSHEWADLYCGGGTDRKNVNLYRVWFFCKKCLVSREKLFDFSKVRLHEDYEQEREDKGL